jgi:hypothetical protein
MSIGGRFFGTSNSNPGGGAGWFPGTARPGFRQRHVAASADIPVPRVLGKGTVPTAVRGALKLLDRAMNRKISKSLPGGPLGGGDGGDLLTGGGTISNLAQLWIQAGGPSSWAPVMAAVAMAESGGRNVIQQGKPYGETGWGLWQITPGNSEPQFGVNQALLNPLNNARAAVAKFRSQGPGAWTTYNNGAYRSFLGSAGIGHRAKGGFIGAAQGLSHIARSKKGTGRPGHKRTPVVSKATTAQLAILSKAGQQVSDLETEIASLSTQFGSMSSRFSTDEGALQYLSDDGSLNAAGIAKKTADDKVLLGLAQKLLWDYTVELTPVSKELRKWLGVKSTTQGEIDKLNTKLTKNAIKEDSLRTARTDLGKPSKDVVGAIEASIRKVKDKWDPTVQAAVKAEKLFHGYPVPPVYRGTNKKEKAKNVAARAAAIARNTKTHQNLADAVTLARSQEQTALNPLQNALDAARVERAKRAATIKAKRSEIQIELRGLTNADDAMRRRIRSLKGIQAGSPVAGGSVEVNKAVTTLENVAGKLGTVMWSPKGKFLRIDTTHQGAAYDEQTTVNSLINTIGQDAQLKVSTTEDAQTAADQAALSTMYQTAAENMAQQLAISQLQYGAFSSLAPIKLPTPTINAVSLPPYGGSFQQGGIVPGPLGAPKTIVAHGGEEVGLPSSNDVHLHFANGMEWLKDYVSAEVADSTRGMARRAARMMPGRGGGVLITR